MRVCCYCSGPPMIRSIPPTFVALKYLCDTPRLQVPDVDFAIFASANNVVAISSAESGS